jgi:hypothetical protein
LTVLSVLEPTHELTFDWDQTSPVSDGREEEVFGEGVNATTFNVGEKGCVEWEWTG